MTQEQAELIVKTATYAGFDVNYREAYSGRGMFSKTTWAVTGDKTDILEVLSRLDIPASRFRFDSIDKYDVVCY
jgi:hypothetical protein